MFLMFYQKILGAGMASGDWIIIPGWQTFQEWNFNDLVNISIKYGYWLIMIAGVVFSSYKFIVSIKNFFGTDNPQLKSQYKNDLIEIVVGLLLISVGLSVILLIVEKLGIVSTGIFNGIL